MSNEDRVVSRSRAACMSIKLFNILDGFSCYLFRSAYEGVWLVNVFFSVGLDSAVDCVWHCLPSACFHQLHWPSATVGETASPLALLQSSSFSERSEVVLIIAEGISHTADVTLWSISDWNAFQRHFDSYFSTIFHLTSAWGWNHLQTLSLETSVDITSPLQRLDRSNRLNDEPHVRLHEHLHELHERMSLARRQQAPAAIYLPPWGIESLVLLPK